MPQVEFLEQFFIPIGLRLAQIIEQAPTHRHHLQEAAARRMIFGVAFEVIGQLRDPPGEKCNLHIRTAGIFRVKLKFLHVQRVTAICHKRVGSLNEERVLARGSSSQLNWKSLRRGKEQPPRSEAVTLPIQSLAS